MYLQKVISKKKLRKKALFVDVLKDTDENSLIRIRIRILQSDVWILGSGSVPKFHRSAILMK